MGKIFLGVLVAVAAVVLAESLVCNQCSASVFGVCLNQANLTCPTNTSVCFTARTEIPGVSSFSGFSSQGCREPAGCNATTNSTIVLGITLSTQIQCCSSTRCNPITISGAPSATMSLTAAVGAALLASVLGSVL